ncbi:MAG: hypothetical protein AAFO69_13015 [Bacteroidota bacterium]
MKNIIIGIVVVALCGVSIFTFLITEEADKSHGQIISLAKQVKEAELKADRLKELAEVQAEKAMEAEVQASQLQEQLANCGKK